MSTFLVANFSRYRVSVDRAVPKFIADIRDAQSRAASSFRFDNSFRCGYGITYLNQTSYRMYTSPAASSNCATLNRNYEPALDLTVRDVSLAEAGVVIMGTFSDIFFEPPDPKTFIGGVSTPNGSPSTIVIGPTGADCLNNSACKTVCVYPSGKIETVVGDSVNCPGF